MSKSKSKKHPRAENLPLTKKLPRAEAISFSDSNKPLFKTDRMDLEGRWNWNGLDTNDLKDLLEKLFNMQKMSWQELLAQGSHLAKVEKLIPEAQQRLEELLQDDLDELYSLHLTAKRRIWGIKDANILWLLWWDPLHEVYPCNKKYT